MPAADVVRGPSGRSGMPFETTLEQLEVEARGFDPGTLPAGPLDPDMPLSRVISQRDRNERLQSVLTPAPEPFPGIPAFR